MKECVGGRRLCTSSSVPCAFLLFLCILFLYLLGSREREREREEINNECFFFLFIERLFLFKFWLLLVSRLATRMIGGVEGWKRAQNAHRQGPPVHIVLVSERRWGSQTQADVKIPQTECNNITNTRPKSKIVRSRILTDVIDPCLHANSAMQHSLFCS